MTEIIYMEAHPYVRLGSCMYADGPVHYNYTQPDNAASPAASAAASPYAGAAAAAAGGGGGNSRKRSRSVAEGKVFLSLRMVVYGGV